jgi:small subunit ribosomal protein S26e
MSWDPGMTKKRKSRGRSKGSQGRSGTVQCSYCGAQVPKDKAKKITRYTNLVESRLLKELQNQGAQIARYQTTKYLCVSCAVHRGVVKVRGKEERKDRPMRRRPA